MAVVALIAREIAEAGLDVAKWDALFVTAWITAIAGLWLARGQRRRLERLVTRLANRGVLRGLHGAPSEREVTLLRAEIESRAARWAQRSGPTFAALVAAAFVIVNANRDAELPLLYVIGGPLAGAIGGFVVGRSLGRLLSYGSISRLIFDQKLTLRSQPGHVDGAAGLKPLGDFYVAQAGLIALPALFLLIWTFLFLVPPWNERYGDWRGTYLALLALATSLQIAAFVLPLWRVHKQMSDDKDQELEKADRLIAPRIAAGRTDLGSELTNDERAAIRDRLDYLVHSYEAIEGMPTWPVDSRLRRRLTLGNLALIVPLVSQTLALAGRA